MAKYRIDGTKRDTGEPVDVHVDCPDAAEAGAIAAHRGIDVRQITAAADVGPPPQPAGETPPPPERQSNQSDATGGLIPYKNMPALIGYYLAVFSLMPGIGLLLVIPAMVLGVLGIVRYRRVRASKGLAHAWVAILLPVVSVACQVWFVIYLQKLS